MMTGTVSYEDKARRTYDPGILEGNHVVNVEVPGVSRRFCVVRADPCARLGNAGTIDHDVGPVAFQDEFPSAGGQSQNET